MTEQVFKHCRGCGSDRPLEDFPRHKRHRDGRTSRCRWCISAAQRTSRAKAVRPLNLQEFVRFMGKVRVQEDGCWEWQGTRDRDGYGSFSQGGRSLRAHRCMLLFVDRVIPPGLVTDHLCRNRGCVNPSHLEAVDNSTNCRRGERATKTHCVRGHPLSGDNLYVWPGRPTDRGCKACRRACVAAHYGTPEGREWMKRYQQEWHRGRRARASN
jgi:hypothetical protein